LPDGRIYKKCLRLGPSSVVRDAGRSGTLPPVWDFDNTFMLASDPGLVQFVQRVSAMCRGNAYFTTPQTLGNYLMMDFLNRKMKTVH
jgi:Ca-activated chloride channel family protein